MARLASLLPLAVIGGVVAGPAGARADALDPLWARIAADVDAGRPLVVEAHVALCDNAVIACGSRALGDGDNLATNLYWATSGGLRGWFERRGAGWERLGALPAALDGEREVRLYRRQVAPTAALRARGVRRPFAVVVVAHAWRGRRIDAALDQFVADVAGRTARPVTLPDGTRVDGGGAAHLVAYLGHNGWMDRKAVRFPAAAAAAPPKGVFAIACLTRSWLAGPAADAPLFALDAPSSRVPLVLTADLLFAGAASFERALDAFARGDGLAAIRDAAAAGYAESEHKPPARVRSLFTNASDPRWRHLD